MLTYQSRSAAVSELVGEDSSECIQIYQTSTLLLEAVIEPLPKDAGSNEHIKESEIATVVQRKLILHTIL